MKRKKQILSAVILSGSVGLGVNSLFAQGAPGSGQPGPTPQPRQTQPTIPGQPGGPGLPQTEPMPGQPGTIPERVERPSAGDKGMVVSSDDIKKAKVALKAKAVNPGPIDVTLDRKTQQALTAARSIEHRHPRSDRSRVVAGANGRPAPNAARAFGASASAAARTPLGGRRRGADHGRHRLSRAIRPRPRAAHHRRDRRDHPWHLAPRPTRNPHLLRSRRTRPDRHAPGAA